MNQEAVQLFGGPLDGLHLVIPEHTPELHFPVLACGPGGLDNSAEIDSNVPIEDLVYVWKADVQRYLWSS
jgi:hypothetical protein